MGGCGKKRPHEGSFGASKESKEALVSAHRWPAAAATRRGVAAGRRAWGKPHACGTLPAGAKPAVKHKNMVFPAWLSEGGRFRK